MKNKKSNFKIIQSLFLSLILIYSTMFTGGSKVLATTSSTTTKIIKDFNTDKSMYNRKR